MTKSELIEIISQKQKHLSYKDIEFAIKTMIEQMAQSLANGERIEIRGFGSFSLHFRPPRMGRNPKTGEPVPLAGKHVPHFKPGKELRERVNGGLQKERARQSPSAHTDKLMTREMS
jgi:integration host factor subunit beta